MHYDLDQLKTADHLRDYCEKTLESRGRDAYVCPVCGSGNGKNRTAAFHVNADHWKCFSCGNGGDLLELIGAVEGIEDFDERARRAAEFCGVTVSTHDQTQERREPEILPPHQHADKILIVAATPQEEARVRNLGYLAARCEDGNYIKFVSALKGTGLTLVSMLNAETKKELADSCAHFGVPFVVVQPEVVARAYESDEALSKALFNAGMRYDESITDSNERRLRAVGVHPSWDVTMDVLCGLFVRESIATGIGSIDGSIGGIPRGGVTVIGALSSTGKTSLCVQVADHLAQNGTPVLFATLEQDRHELAIMSLSRIIGKRGYDYVRKQPVVYENEHGAYLPVTRQWLQSGPATWTAELDEAITSAAAEYDSYASENLHYMQTEEAPTVTGIRIAAETVRAVHGGVSPVVIIDYLQLLAHPDQRDERLAVNEAMSSLRRMARDLNTAVVVISALNRASLTQGVTLASLRESGGIEYSADLVLGLQPAALTEKVREDKGEVKASEVNKIIDDFRDEDVKRLDLRVLKNRGGIVPKDTPALYFDGRCSLFYSGR